MKKILGSIKNIFRIFIKGFYFLCSILAKGFFFYPKKFFMFLKKIFKNSSRLDKIIKHFEKRQLQPEFCLLFILYFVAGCTLFRILYVKPADVVHNFDIASLQDKTNSIPSGVSSNTSSDTNNNSQVFVDNNPFRKFASTSLENVNMAGLKTQNSDVVAWISVDGTNINYPVVQTSNNDYYLNHSFYKYKTYNGWVFMDYRNSYNFEDNNTIIYGHNLLNKTAFGSLENVFTKKWVENSNKSIVVITEGKTYYFTVFSAYYTSPETYYLQNVFYGEDSYQAFLNIIRSRNILAIDNSVSVNDKIITLSTCNDGSSGRKVVHAKLVAVY